MNSTGGLPVTSVPGPMQGQDAERLLGVAGAAHVNPRRGSGDTQARSRRMVLKMSNISKTFGSVTTLKDVGLVVYAGEVHALMGENGAGKSTLMKILAGAYKADPGGEICIDGRLVSIDGPLSARRHGISIIYQELALAPNLTVAENIYLGRETSHGGVVLKTRMADQCSDVLKRIGADFGPDTKVAKLSLAQRQLVEIGRALHARSKIIIMDEPTTTLSSREADRLFDLMRQLRDDGVAIIYISHPMAEVYELADHVSVLRDGQYVGTLARKDATPEAIVRMMVGRDLSSLYKKEHKPARDPVPALEVRYISDGIRVRGCSFALHGGEVLGLAGLVGAGRTELAYLICGARTRLSGEILVAGRKVDFRTPRQSQDAGIAYLTEDRKGLGVFLDMTVSENINLGICGRDAYGGWILNRKRAQQRAAQAIDSLLIRVTSAGTPVGALSGGNQQKVLLSRLLETRPKILILDEPTRGVDIGAKSEIYRIVDDLAKAGVAVLVISSELSEVIGMSDRVIVMREGEIAGSLGSGNRAITEENIIALATGAGCMPQQGRSN